MYVGNMFCVFSLCCCLLLNWMDFRAERMRMDNHGSVESVASDDEDLVPCSLLPAALCASVSTEKKGGRDAVCERSDAVAGVAGNCAASQ
jgi:hypothetical protein